MRALDEAAIDAAWRDVEAIPKSRVAMEMGRANREQRELSSFIWSYTEGMGPGVAELAGFIYVVLWRVFRASGSGPVKPVAAEAIKRRLEQNEQDLMRLDGTDPLQIDEVALAGLTRQPAILRYVIEAIASAEEDENQPVAMSPEEKGTLILLLKTAIDTLDEA